MLVKEAPDVIAVPVPLSSAGISAGSGMTTNVLFKMYITGHLLLISVGHKLAENI